MPKFYVMPEGYDPMVAAGPPGRTAKRAGCDWTPEDTARHKEMESKGRIVEGEKPPVGLWSWAVDEKFIPPEPAYPEGEVGVIVYLGNSDVPDMGEPIGKTPDLSPEQIKFALMVAQAVEKTLKKAGLLRQDAIIDVFTTD